MKKRGRLLILALAFFLISLPNSFSIYQESVFSGTVEDAGIVEIEGINFKFVIEQVSSKVFVQFGQFSLIVPSGECKIQNSYNICVLNVSYSHRNASTVQDIYKAIVSISQIKSKLISTHAIEKENLLIDEESTATLILENTADIAAKDVIAEIGIPENLFLKEASGCRKLYGKIIFSGDIYPKQVIACSYKIIGLKGGEFELNPEITYFDGIEAINYSSSAIKGKVYNHSLKISMSSNESLYKTGERFNLTLVVENTNDEYPIDVNIMNVRIPKNLLVAKTPKEFIKNNDIMAWSGNLAAEESKAFLIEMQSNRAANYSVEAAASYKISSFSRSANQGFNVEIGCDCPYISYKLVPESLEPGKSATLTAFLFNPSSSNEFNNVGIKYSSSIPKIADFTNGYSKIGPQESLPIIDVSFIVPSADSAINITAAYSANGQSFAVEAEIPIKPITVYSENNPENSSGNASIEEGKSLAEEPEKPKAEPNANIVSGASEGMEEQSEEPSIELDSQFQDKSYMVFAVIGILVAILVVFFILRKKNVLSLIPKRHSTQQTQQPKQESKQESKQELKLGEHKRAENQKHVVENNEINSLEDEIKRLGNIFERRNEKKGFFGMFRKK